MKSICDQMRMSGLAAGAIVVVMLFTAGCAGTYSGAYYSPNYSPYYADYGYAGGPYYGYDPGYIGGFVVTGGSHYHRYYGGHHFSHEAFRSRAASHSTGVSVGRGGRRH